MTAPPAPTRGWALFLDFDGVLSGLVADPADAGMTPGRAALLERLAGRLGGALAVVSGRGLFDLAQRVPQGVWRSGGHGMDLAAPGEVAVPLAASPPALLAAVEAAIAGMEGVWIEAKGPVLAIHYRAAPEARDRLGAALRDVAEAQAGYGLHGGKSIWELKPEGADKGRAVAALMARPPFAGRVPVFVGDDVTDEDGFRAVLERGGLAVKVGEGETLAGFRLADVEAVWDWLARTA